MTSPTLSLVIPAYNEADSIGWLLESLMTELDQLDEIIVVDNNSTDETPQIVAGFTDRIAQLRVVTEKRPGVIAARNAGFDSATGDIIGGSTPTPERSPVGPARSASSSRLPTRQSVRAPVSSTNTTCPCNGCTGSC